MKKTKLLVLCTVVVILLVSLVSIKWNVIWQRGNPIPYLAAALKLSDEDPFIAVENMECIYISKRDEKDALFRMIENTYHVEYKDQLGSSYLFTDGTQNYIVGSEIYWSVFTVWTLSFDNGFPS